MSLDHEAILKAYEGTVVSVDDGDGAKDANGNVIKLDQAKIDEARVLLDAEIAANKYKMDRLIDGTTTYAQIGEQLGMLYDDIIAGKLDATGKFATHNKAVKDANPKP